MTLAIIILCCMAIVLIVWGIIRRYAHRKRPLVELESALYPVDTIALGNLLQSGEDTFLRGNLDAKNYRFIKRKRIRAAQEYIARISDNALILSKIAGMALDSPDPQIHEIALKLSRDAVQVRSYALRISLLLMVQWVYPELDLSSLKVRERYASLAENASWFYRLRFPDSPTRIATALCG